jgi:hypothetical protein
MSKMTNNSFMRAYHDLIDWNVKFLAKDYEPIEAAVLDDLLSVIPEEWGLEEGHWIEGYLDFCPKCGCVDKRGTDNMATYPEAFYKTYCASCGFLLAMVDNSPCCMWYQYKDNDYKVEI